MKCVVKVDVVNTAQSNLIGMRPENDCWVTDINGTPDEVREYYKIGKVFGMGYGHCDVFGKRHEDHLMQVENVFVLESCEKTNQFVNWLGKKYGWDWKEHFDEMEYTKFCSLKP